MKGWEQMELGFKGLHPVTSFTFFLFTFLLSIFSTSPYLLFLCFLCALLYDIKLRKKAALSYFFKFILPFILLITTFNGIFNHYGVTVLFVMKNGNSFTLEAIAYGLVSAIRLAAVLLWLDCFNEIVTSEKIIFLFSRFSPRTALTLSMVLRFIPLIRNQSKEIIKAEKGIGNGLNAVSLKGKLKTVTRRLSILVSWTLEKGIDTSFSMKARGYGLKKRTFYNDYMFLLKDGLFLLSVLFSAVISVLFKERLIASYNPVISIPPFDGITALICVLFLFVLLSPAIYDLKEEKLWSTSK